MGGAPGRRGPVVRGAAVLVGLALVLSLGGCVSWGAHRAVLEERDQLDAESRRLAARVAQLEASAESLAAERVALLSDLEDLRVAREELEAGLADLSRARTELEESLAERERELALHRGEVDRLRETYDGLVRDLQSEVATGRIVIEQLRDGLRVNLAQEILFPLGSAELGSDGEAVLRTVAGRLAELPNRIEVEGHTDDLAIHGALAERFPTNWELGGARAARVVRVLESAGVDGGRLRAVSLGPFAPVASNETDEGRARNRRIEIRLIPDHAAVEAPAGGEAEGPADDEAHAS